MLACHDLSNSDLHACVLSGFAKPVPTSMQNLSSPVLILTQHTQLLLEVIVHIGRRDVELANGRPEVPVECALLLRAQFSRGAGGGGERCIRTGG